MILIKIMEHLASKDFRRGLPARLTTNTYYLNRYGKCYGWCQMRESIAGSLIIIFVAGFLILRLSKRGAMSKYDKKPQSKWNSLSEGVDPTDE